MRTARIAVLMLAVFSGCTMWKEKPANSWSQATGGEHFERLMWQHLKEKRWPEFERHLAPTFVFVNQNGTRDKAATMEFLRQVALTDYTLGDFRTETNGADLVVTYTARMTGTYNGKPLPAGPIRMMTVWQQVTKGWVAIAHSEVRLSD